MALRNYEKEQVKKIKKLDSKPTGVGCTERGCKGELMWSEPRIGHPELKELARAICDKCGWKGWC